MGHIAPPGPSRLTLHPLSPCLTHHGTMALLLPPPWPPHAPTTLLPPPTMYQRPSSTAPECPARGVTLRALPFLPAPAPARDEPTTAVTGCDHSKLCVSSMWTSAKQVAIEPPAHTQHRRGQFEVGGRQRVRGGGEGGMGGY